MTIESDIAKLQPRELADYGFARTRDIAFDAVRTLWARRRDAGMKQIDIANAIGRDPAWVSRNLRGPGNWTLRTLGELVEALGGELEIKVYGLEDPLPIKSNYHAYAEYEPPAAPVGPVRFGASTSTDQTKKFIESAFPTTGASTVSAVPAVAQ